MPLERRPSPVPAPPATQSIPLGRLRVTLDDLDALVTQLSRAGYKPVLAAAQAVATDAKAEDLKDATREELSRVAIGVEEKSLAVHLSKSRAYVEHRVGDADAQRVATEVASILRARRTPEPLVWLWAVTRNFLLFASFLLVTVGVGVTLRPETAGPFIGVALAWPLAFLAACSIGLGSMTYASSRGDGGATVLPYFRRERREVKFSTAQALWIGLVIAVVGAIVGAVAQATLSAEDTPQPTPTITQTP